MDASRPAFVARVLLPPGTGYNDDATDARACFMIRLVRIGGVSFGVDTGWVLLFGVITCTLATRFVPQTVPGLPPLLSWVWAVATAGLLFGSVLLHELSHALIARRHGVAVGTIRLHLFGGISELESEPATPRAEFSIAIVGPLTSFAVAALSLLANALAHGSVLASAILSYLATVNVLLGAFNLLPGLPLDGGRIVRAALWAWSRRWSWATRLASRTGIFVALGLAAVGSMRAFAGDVLGGGWLVVIGIFLLRAAGSSHELASVRGRLEPIRVKDVMRRGGLVPTAPGARFRHVPVAVPGEAVTPQDSAWLAFLRMSRSGVGRVLVVDTGRPVGTVGRREIEQALADGVPLVQRAA